MPREITIDGLTIDDRQHPKDYAGPYLFTDPDGTSSTAAHPFPYRLTERMTLRILTATSGRKPRVSPDAAVAASVRVIELNERERLPAVLSRFMVDKKKEDAVLALERTRELARELGIAG